MQASKIKPKQVYAVKRGSTLARFRVNSVITERIDSTGSPHDFKSVVTGYFVNHRGAEENERVTFKPDAILGPFEEYAELVEHERREKEAAEKVAADAAAAREHLRRLLYQASGVPIPNDEKQHSHQAFRVTYSGVDIDRIGIEPLTKVLEAYVRSRQ